MLYHSTSFSDLDLLRESAVDWRLDFLPLAAGQFNFDITQAVFENAMVGHGNFNGKLEQQGLTPPGFRTFVIPANHEVAYKWRGQPIDGQSLSLFPPHGELYSISDSSFDVFTMSFRQDLFDRVLASIKNTSLERMVANENIWRLDQASVQRLQYLVQSFLKICAIGGSIKDKAEVLLKAIFEAIELRTGFGIGQRVKRKQAVILSATKWLQQHPTNAARIKDLYKAINLPERTVQHIFKQEVGLSPKRYLKNFRIRQVHVRLKKPVDGLTIADIAAQYGFWHFSQFAKDYKRIIGELPSETRMRYYNSSA